MIKLENPFLLRMLETSSFVFFSATTTVVLSEPFQLESEPSR